ncbi:MAG: hypothetical protein HC853_09915 [Anaerolineae bacterium]|nr:hypothetical protein [Anaerolineae bacterium]
MPDRLALKGYEYAHGWVSNFEEAAEGLIQSARKESIDDSTVLKIIQILIRLVFWPSKVCKPWVLRCQPLVALSGWSARMVRRKAWLSPMDNGGCVRSIRAASPYLVSSPWQTKATHSTSQPRVVSSGATTTSGAWPAPRHPIQVAFPADLRPFSIRARNGIALVGTSNGVYEFNGTNWQLWGDLGTLALQMAEVSVPIATPPGMRVARYAVTLLQVMLRFSSDWSNADPSNPFTLPQDDFVTAIVEATDVVYVGTLRHGVYRQIHTGGQSVIWENMLDFSQLNSQSVMQLAARANQLYIGTTQGLFIAQNPTSSNVTVTPEPELVGKCVTAILAPANDPALFVGTADSIDLCSGDAWHTVGPRITLVIGGENGRSTFSHESSCSNERHPYAPHFGFVDVSGINPA